MYILLPGSLLFIEELPIDRSFNDFYAKTGTFEVVDELLTQLGALAPGLDIFLLPPVFVIE
jgi:hypothetical protein